MRPIVLVPQEPMRKVDGRWVSKGLNIAASEEFGRPVYIWGPTADTSCRAEIEKAANDAAAMYDDRRDFLIAIGSPTLIAAVAWAIGSSGKRLRVLEWDKMIERYTPSFGDRNES